MRGERGHCKSETQELLVETSRDRGHRCNVGQLTSYLGAMLQHQRGASAQCPEAGDSHLCAFQELSGCRGLAVYEVLRRRPGVSLVQRPTLCSYVWSCMYLTGCTCSPATAASDLGARRRRPASTPQTRTAFRQLQFEWGSRSCGVLSRVVCFAGVGTCKPQRTHAC